MPTPYSGNPASFPGEVPIPAPTDVPTALLFQTAFKGTIDRTAFLNRLALTPNFEPSYSTILPLATFKTAAWDPTTLRWIVAGLTSGPLLQVSEGRGDENGWAAPGIACPDGGLSPTSVCRGVGSSFSQNIYVASIATGNLVAVYDTIANSWATHSVLVSATDIVSMNLLALPGVLVCAMGSNVTPAHSNVFYSTDSGVTWTPQAATSPVVLVPKWIIAQQSIGGGPVLCFPELLGLAGFLSSPDGITWTEVAGITLGANEGPTGLCYGADNQGIPCWTLATYDTSTPTTKLYRSYDGLAFAPFSNNLGNNL
ncbi:MAG TPA: hypothetical protein VII82_14240, partial [Polyangiaceae bacterium]